MAAKEKRTEEVGKAKVEAEIDSDKTQAEDEGDGSETPVMPLNSAISDEKYVLRGKVKAQKYKVFKKGTVIYKAKDANLIHRLKVVNASAVTEAGDKATLTEDITLNIGVRYPRGYKLDPKKSEEKALIDELTVSHPAVIGLKETDQKIKILTSDKEE